MEIKKTFKRAGIMTLMITVLLGVLTFTSKVQASSRHYSVDFSGSWVSGLANGITFSGKSGTYKLSSSYYLSAAAGAPWDTKYTVSVELKSRNSLGFTKVEGKQKSIASPEIARGYYYGPSVSGSVSWTNIPARDSFYFVTYKDSYSPPIFVIGSGTVIYP